MLVTPRLYQQSQSYSDKELWSSIRERFSPSSGWYDLPASTVRHVRKMRLVHQTGTVKVGEVARYTITYNPSRDRVLPTPQALFVRIKNSSAIALRAAYLHGPYNLYAACYPASFDPNLTQPQTEEFGKPQFEPNLRAGGTWNAQIKIPEDIRETTLGSRSGDSASQGGSVTWVIEVSSQVLFSTSAAVHYEILVGRDEKSVDFGFAGMGGGSNTTPGHLSDYQQHSKKEKRRSAQARGVYSEAITLQVADTARIWNTPELPEVAQDEEERKRLRTNPILRQSDPSKLKDEDYRERPKDVHEDNAGSAPKKRDRQNVHLVLLTHGLHSNLGADMLYLKESIDAAAKQARLDRKMRKAKEQSTAKATEGESTSSGTTAHANSTSEDDEDEQVIVRGFPGNAVRTERGIQYLGKRLAKYVLAMTYPDQPYLPVKKKSVGSSFSKAFGGGKNDLPEDMLGPPSHNRSTIHKEEIPEANLAYKITSISFVGHSLGGLTQTYAVAYIQKHSPEFFQLIKPVNFVALASPFLGLSNENPLYVKFALDFGLVGRTGQDLGLTWRAPTIARSGWGAMIAGMGADGQKNKKQLNPGSKPLLRILPSGPAHQALKLFRNRTVYSNVVNDGIVPLRTSCLLFLDWRGLGRVEKARRDNGLVGTMAGWGWAELTGQNTTDQRKGKETVTVNGDFSNENSGDERSNTPTMQGQGDTVPQPATNATQEDNAMEPESPVAGNFHNAGRERNDDEGNGTRKQRAKSTDEQGSGPFSGFLSMLKPGTNKNEPPPKKSKIYRRSQTTAVSASSDGETSPSTAIQDGSQERPDLVRGNSILQEDQVVAPPSTSVFEAAGDLLNPPLPDDNYINDPTNRPRTIFHDRIYHPEDIPSPPMKKKSLRRRSSSNEEPSSRTSSISMHSNSSAGSIDTSNMKVEEKIARAYHWELSWRKVLVRLEPDAHNNIIVRRMFANAYGWPVVKHLVDTHFADNYVSKTADGKESNEERSKPMSRGVNEQGEEVKRQNKRSRSVEHSRNSEGEERDELHRLPGPDVGRHSSVRKPRILREDSATWDDRFFASEDDEDEEEYFQSPRSPKPRLGLGIPTHGRNVSGSSGSDKGNSPKAERTQPMVLSDLTMSPASATTHNIGLQKSIEEHLDTAKRDGL